MATTITFDPRKGPVTVEISSGHGTVGYYRLAFRLEEPGELYQEFGTEPKALDDDIPDDHLVPVAPDELTAYSVLVLGKYRPAYGSRLINVTYRFFQDHGQVHATTLKNKLPDDDEYVRVRHRYRFKAEA